MDQNGKAAVAEFLGTFALCFFGAGAVCTNAWTQGAVGLLGIALAHAAVLAVMVSSLGHISGAHFNPAVTLGLLSAGKIDRARALTYIVAQLAGGVAAGLLLRTIIPAVVWQEVQLGTPAVAAGVSVTAAVVLEAVMTFFLVLAVFGTAVDSKGSWNAIAGFGIGTVLLFDILVGGPFTGASMNPARTFGPAVAAGYWDNHLVYWLGPIIGGVLAGNLYSTVFLSGKK